MEYCNYVGVWRKVDSVGWTRAFGIGYHRVTVLLWASNSPISDWAMEGRY